MAYNISAFAGAGAQFLTDNGDPLTGGLLYVYTAGTTTPATTWTSNSGSVANTNPIVLDAAGRTPAEIWVNSGVTYKFILKTSAGVLVGTYDNIPAIDDPTVFNNLITVTGTNTLIGTAVPPYTSYLSGMTISFVPVATNTGAVTIDIDGLGAKNIYYDNATSLAANAIIAGKIVSLEYDGTRFQMTNSVTTSQIADGSITTAKLANNAVTTVKIADANVTTVKIADANVTTVKIADANVTTAKIGDAAVTAAKLDSASPGTAPIYAARAWVNFNGTGTVASRASGNVSSITDNGTGDYTVNFTTAMSDANYAVAVQAKILDVFTRLDLITVDNRTAASAQIKTFVAATTTSTTLTAYDPTTVDLVVFR